jgi:peptide-methionine (S)-S-oxide reductase
MLYTKNIMRLVKIIISITFLVLISHDIYSQNKNNMELATFGSGCFWCSEAIFSRLKGVESVISGYSGGSVENPTYKQVGSGETGHAEVI